MRERFSMQPCFNEETQQPASERLTKVCGQDSRVHKKTRQGERPSRDEPRLPDELLLKYFYLGPKIFLQKVSKNTGVCKMFWLSIYCWEVNIGSTFYSLEELLLVRGLLLDIDQVELVATSGGPGYVLAQAWPDSSPPPPNNPTLKTMTHELLLWNTSIIKKQKKKGTT